MKRILTYLGAVAAAAICFSACQKEQENPVKGASHTITFTAESAKTVIDGTGVVWTEEDKDNFYIFEDGIKATSVVVTIVDHKATAVATFAGEGTGSHQYNAYVTGSVDAEDSPVISTEQTATSTSFDSDADILIAKPITGENTAFTFEFKRYVSIAKMHIKGITAGETVDFVKISNHGETGALAGTYDPATGAFTPTTGEDKIVVTTAGTDPVFFMVAENEEITPTVQVWTDKGVYTKTFDKAIDFPMGKIREFSVQYSADQRVDRPKDYTLVTSVEELEEGSLIVIGCKSQDAVAGPIASDKVFMSSENATITEEGVLTPGINSDVEEITLGKNGEYWTLITKSGKIGADGSKNLYYGSNIMTWTIDIDANNNAEITCSTSANGVFQYNSDASRFKTYAATYSGKSVQIYKYDDGKTPLAQPVITLTPDATAKTVSVSWEAVPNATSYVVSCTGKDDIPTTGTTAQFTGLEYDVNYTVTVKAVGNDTYRDSQASQNFKMKDPAEVLDTMDKIYAKAQKLGSTGGTVEITFCNWVVSGVSGNNAYLTDGTKGMILYKYNHGFVKGDILSGAAECTLKLYNNAAETTDLTASTTGLTVTKGGSVSANPATIAGLSGINTGAYVSLSNLTYNGTVFTDGTKTITPYNSFITLPDFTTGVKYNIKGVYLEYVSGGNTKQQISPLSLEDISEVPAAKYAITIASGIQHGTVTTNPATEAAEGAEVTLTATPDEGYKLKSWSVKKTATSEAITVTDDKFTMPAEAVTVSAEFEVGIETKTFTVKSDDVVTNSTYSTYETTVEKRDWIITFGGNNKSVGTNSGNRSKCNLGSYTKYAVSPVTSSGVASAFAGKTKLNNVKGISYTFNGGSNQTSTKVYVIYSSDNTTFSQLTLTKGTQGANIATGTSFEFAKCSGYFAVVFEATNPSGNWRIDDVNLTFTYEE